jgi:acylphosphatase
VDGGGPDAGAGQGAAPVPIRVRVVVRGRVQGVWFRETCRREALGRGISGWVRNRPDGAVEAVFEGREEAVRAILAWCRVGSPLARIDDVEVRSEEPEGVDGFGVEA